MAPPSISVAASFPQNPKIHQIPISRRLSPTVGTASPSRSVSSADSLRAKTDLLRLISDQERGLRTQTNPSKRKEIIGAIEELALHGDGTITTDSSLSCTWRMLWTTEKEQLFIIKNARLFGTETGDVLQVIDVEKGLLNNVITFPPSGVFFVRSKIEAEPPQRVNFRFTSAVIRGSKWEIPLPPFGRGWICEREGDCELTVRIRFEVIGGLLCASQIPSVAHRRDHCMYSEPPAIVYNCC